jgi:hypothetical protein
VERTCLAIPNICLGRVAYPIDFNVLDNVSEDDDDFSGNWNVPVALKLNVGDINISASREAIEYTEETKKFLRKKLTAMKEEMVAMLVKQHENMNSLEEYYRVLNDSSLLILSKEESVNISAFTKNREVVLKKFNEINIPSSFEIINKFYDISMFGKKARRENIWDKSLKGVATDKVYFVTDNDNMTRKKNAYMKFTYKHFFTLRRSELSFGEVKDLIKEITPKNSTVDSKIIFKQFRELQKDVYKLIEGQAKTYASVTVPDGFTVSSAKGYDPNQELPVTYNSKYGFDKERIKIQKLVECKSTLYYGDLDDQSIMSAYDNLYRTLFSPKEDQKKFGLLNWDACAFPIRFIMVSKSNMKFITQLKNVKPYNEFSKVLSRKREAIIKQIEKQMFEQRYQRQSELFLNDKLFNVIDKTYAKKVTELKALRKKYDAVKVYSVSTTKDSSLVSWMNIDFDSITYKGHDLFAAVEKATEKNGMLDYVKIRRDFDPTDVNEHGEKEIANILKLLKLAYVK